MWNSFKDWWLSKKYWVEIGPFHDPIIQAIYWGPAIRVVLPHRDRWQLPHRVTVSKRDGQLYAQGRMIVRPNHCDGHFGVFPGVLYIELVAQTAAILWLYKKGMMPKPETSRPNPIAKIVQRIKGVPRLANCKVRVPGFGGVDGVKVRRVLQPGETLVAQVEIGKEKRDIVRVKGEVFIEETPGFLGERIGVVNELTGILIEVDPW